MRVPPAASAVPPAYLAMAAAHMDSMGKLFSQPANGTGQPVAPADPATAGVPDVPGN